MSIAEVLGMESPETPKNVELVTLTPEQIATGNVEGTTVPFPDIVTALQYAKTMPEEQRRETWIRLGSDTKTLDQAEADLKFPQKEIASMADGKQL